MVLRAFATHPVYRAIPEARYAAELLASRFFQKDVYTSCQSASYWVRFDYPFWWNNLVAALDAVAKIGLRADDPDIRRGLDWLLEYQEPGGLWLLEYGKPGKPGKIAPRVHQKQLWVSLAICRILRHYFP